MSFSIISNTTPCPISKKVQLTVFFLLANLMTTPASHATGCLEALDDFARGKFVKIKGRGLFKDHFLSMKNGRRLFNKAMRRWSYEFQTTPVTEWQWAQIMGGNTPWFQHGPAFSIIPVKGKSVSMRPNHPVVATEEDHEAFVKKLNELASVNDPVVKEIIPDHQNGDRYDIPFGEEYLFIHWTTLKKKQNGNEAEDLNIVAQPDGQALSMGVTRMEWIPMNEQLIYGLYSGQTEMNINLLGSRRTNLEPDPSVELYSLRLVRNRRQR